MNSSLVQSRPLTILSHLAANLEARLAELLIIFPVFSIPCIQKSCKSVRALGDTELWETRSPLNEKAHQSCVIRRGGYVWEERSKMYENVVRERATFKLCPESQTSILQWASLRVCQIQYNESTLMAH